MADVEAEVVAAGASPASVEVRVEEVPERSTLRAVAVGSVGLASGATPGRDEIDLDGAAGPRRRRHRRDQRRSVLAGAQRRRHRGRSIATATRRFACAASWCAEDDLSAAIERLTRYRGPITLRPTHVDHRRSTAARARRRSGDRPIRTPDVPTSPTSSEGSADGPLRLRRQAIPPHASSSPSWRRVDRARRRLG